MVKSSIIKDIIHEQSFDIDRLAIKRENIQIALGYKTGNAPDYLLREIDLAFSELYSINDIYGGFRIVYEDTLLVKDNGFCLGNIIFNTGTLIASNLKESDYIAFFLVTAGNVISRRIKELNESHNYLKAYIYDIIGSEIAGRACDVIQSMIEEKAKAADLSITNRYSPGYCDWDVREQDILISFLPDNFCHVVLMESALMVPIKSVSGIIGIGKKAVKGNWGCSLCTMTSCYKRRKSVDVHK